MKIHHTADAFQRNRLPAGEWLGGSLQALHPHTVGEEQAADGRLYRFRQPTSFPTNDKAQTGPAFRVSPGRCLRHLQIFRNLSPRDSLTFKTNDKLPAGPAFRVSPGRLWQPSKANGQSQEVQQAYTL